MTAHRSRRWFQLSLKSLFLLVLLVATFFAGYTVATKQAERERRQAEMEAQRQAEEARQQRLFVAGSNSLGQAILDFDSDGQIDILVTNQSGAPTLYRNSGEGTFQDVKGALGSGK